MGKKHTEARKRDWAKLTPEQRSERASLAATSRWGRMSPKARVAHARLMANSRWGK